MLKHMGLVKDICRETSLGTIYRVWLKREHDHLWHHSSKVSSNVITPILLVFSLLYNNILNFSSNNCLLLQTIDIEKLRIFLPVNSGDLAMIFSHHRCKVWQILCYIESISMQLGRNFNLWVKASRLTTKFRETTI